MARYYTTEELFECYRCHIQCARREMIDGCHIHQCPNCSKPLFGLQEHTNEWTAISHDPEEYYPTRKCGIGKFSYVGLGQKTLPVIYMEDVSSFPIFCNPCNFGIVASTLEVYEANKRFGCGGNYKLPGVDIVRGGGSFVAPVTENTRVWIGEGEIDLAEFALNDGNGVLWEYFLENDNV